MHKDVLSLLHAMATCILIILAGQLKEIALRILWEVR